MMSLILLLSSVASAPADLGPSWAEFSKGPAFSQSERVEVGTLGFDRDRQQLYYWLRRTVTASAKGTVTWVDSRNCPAVRPVLSNLGQIAMPRPSAPGFEEGGEISLDGVSYLLRAPARFGAREGMITLQSNVDTPLARWVEASLSSLQACWTTGRPQRNAR